MTEERKQLQNEKVKILFEKGLEAKAIADTSQAFIRMPITIKCEGCSTDMKVKIKLLEGRVAGKKQLEIMPGTEKNTFDYSLSNASEESRFCLATKDYAVFNDPSQNMDYTAFYKNQDVKGVEEEK